MSIKAIEKVRERKRGRDHAKCVCVCVKLCMNACTLGVRQRIKCGLTKNEIPYQPNTLDETHVLLYFLKHFAYLISSIVSIHAKTVRMRDKEHVFVRASNDMIE